MSGRFRGPRLTRFVFPIWKVGMVYGEKGHDRTWDVSQADRALPPSHACEFENVFLVFGLASLKRGIKPEPVYFMQRSCLYPHNTQDQM